MTVAVLALATILLLRLGADTERLGQELSPLVDAAMVIKLEALHAHVLTEEIMGGDGTEDTAEVWTHLENARGYAMAMLEGGETDEGVFYPSDSPDVRAQIARALVEFETVWTLTEERFASLAGDQGVGSDADARFDADYDAIVSDLAAIAGRSEHARNTAFQIAVGEARYRLAHGHLITAEILGGDLGEDFGEVTDNFAAAQEALKEQGMPAVFNPFVERIGALSDLAVTRYENMLRATDAAAAGDATYDAAFDAFLESADDAETLVQSYIADELRQMAVHRWIGETIFGVAAIMFLIAAVFAYRMLSRRVIARVSELTDCIERVSGGDFEATLPGWTAEDELGRLKAAIASFQQVLLRQQRLEEDARQAMRDAEAQGEKAEAEARRSAQASAHLGEVGGLVGGQSQQLLDISRQLSERQDQQAALLQNLVQLVEDVKGSAAGNTKVVKEAISVAKTATQLVQEGNELVERAVQEVQNIAESGKQVAGYVTTIEEISFQTNLLALNAAVEAARAGDAGKGFAIVAHEVRDLSQRTAEAAASIAGLMRKTNDYIKAGRDSVDTAQSQFTKIRDAIAGLEGNLDSVGQSSNDQTEAVRRAAEVVDDFKRNFDDAATGPALP